VTARGGACGDTLRLSIATDGQRVIDAGFSADGCGATTAAGSAAVTLVRGQRLLEAAQIGTSAIAAELGGLSPGKHHAADLAADALARGLGEAVRARAALNWPSHGRRLVAMSGGVDSAVAALLSRRQGETVAVTMVIGGQPRITHSLFGLGYSIAAVIANEFTEATNRLYLSAPFEPGLSLLATSMILNLAARLLVWRISHGKAGLV